VRQRCFSRTAAPSDGLRRGFSQPSAGGAEPALRPSADTCSPPVCMLPHKHPTPTPTPPLRSAAAEEVLLDENEEAVKHKFYMVAGFTESPDHRQVGGGGRAPAHVELWLRRKNRMWQFWKWVGARDAPIWGPPPNMSGRKKPSGGAIQH
jgi:hypothetical protein